MKRDVIVGHQQRFLYFVHGHGADDSYEVLTWGESMRLLCLLCALAISLSFASCGNKENTNNLFAQKMSRVFLNSGPEDDRWVSVNPEIPGTDGKIYAMVRSGDYLYIGGDFTFVKNVLANRVAQLHIPSGVWSALGQGIDGPVTRLTVDENGILYASGNFSTAGSSQANYIAKWDGTLWSAMGSGLSERANAFAADSNGTLLS